MKRKIKMSLRSIKNSGLLLILLSVSYMATGQTSDGIMIDKIIAKIDDYIVLKSELEGSYQELISRGTVAGEESKCRLLENLIVNKLMVAKAEIDSVLVAENEVNTELDRRMAYFISQVGSEEKLEEFYGKTLNQFKLELFDQVKEQLVVQKMQGEITADLKVTPSEVRKFFKSIPRDSLPYFSTEVTVAQIVKKPEPGAKQKTRIIAQLNDLRSQIMDGIDFGVLARKYSKDPGSAAQGGVLPFFKRGELAPEYEATALDLKPGEVSMPVETQFGIHIIELIEKRGNSFKSRHILMIPEPSYADRLEARDYLDSLRTAILADSITFEKAASEFSDDQITKGSGGYFRDTNGSNRVSVKELDPNIFFAIDTMAVGNISPPMEFDEQDGTKSYKILYYLGKVPPHQANLDDDYQKIASAALNEKKNRILNNWFNDAQKGIFIQVDKDYDKCNLPIVQ
ncbi:MAG: peptidylprolyl isomerase [Bacteroidota bacterium]